MIPDPINALQTLARQGNIYFNILNSHLTKINLLLSIFKELVTIK